MSSCMSGGNSSITTLSAGALHAQKRNILNETTANASPLVMPTVRFEHAEQPGLARLLLQCLRVWNSVL